MNLAQIADEVSNEIVFGKVISNNPTVLVLVGLQYSGKSYLANLITDKNYAHFWATNIKKKYGIKNQEMIEVAKLVIDDVISKGFNLVIDFVNHKYEIRRQFQDTVNNLGVNYRVVFIDTPKEVRLERRERNVIEGDKPGRRVISIDQMNEFENEFEAPTDSENVIVLRTEDDSSHFLESL